MREPRNMATRRVEDLKSVCMRAFVRHRGQDGYSSAHFIIFLGVWRSSGDFDVMAQEERAYRALAKRAACHGGNGACSS
jgi:hypothetical protein